MQETRVKAGGKENNRLAEISDYVGNRREMEDRKSVPIGSPVGQNEPPVPHWLSHTTEPTNRRQEQDNQHGPEKGRLCWCRKRHGRSGKGVAGREPRSAGEKSCAWVLGMRWRMVEQV
jgi:hypothetical protein